MKFATKDIAFIDTEILYGEGESYSQREKRIRERIKENKNRKRTAHDRKRAKFFWSDAYNKVSKIKSIE